MEFDDYVTSRLNEIETKIINWLILGMTNKQIGEKIFLSSHAVKYYLAKLYKKFGVINRNNLVYILAQHVIKKENCQDAE